MEVKDMGYRDAAMLLSIVAVVITLWASNVVGIDRGIRFIATTYDSKGKTYF